jgi:hypothetical protein
MPYAAASLAAACRHTESQTQELQWVDRMLHFLENKHAMAC